MTHSMVEATHTETAVKSYYRWRASNYDAGAVFEVRHHAEAVQRAGIRPGERVLDVACGTGRGTVGLAEAVGPGGSVEALDLSEDMLGQAKAKIGKLGLAGRVTFRHGNARALPYEDYAFDAVYNGYMFDLIPLDGFGPILKEFQRVLKPGGRLVLVNMSKPGERKTFYETVYEKKWAVMPCRPVLMSASLSAAGFVDIERDYRKNVALFIPLPFGTEIVLARKPARGS